jgi:hypothetical protein
MEGLNVAEVYGGVLSVPCMNKLMYWNPKDAEVYYIFECAAFEWRLSAKRYTVQGYKCEDHRGQQS